MSFLPQGVRTAIASALGRKPRPLPPSTSREGWQGVGGPRYESAGVAARRRRRAQGRRGDFGGHYSPRRSPKAAQHTQRYYVDDPRKGRREVSRDEFRQVQGR